VLLGALATVACGARVITEAGPDAGDGGDANRPHFASFMGASGSSERFDWTERLVIDKETNLAWQRSPSGERLTWNAATRYCAELALEGGGWHLPDKSELLTIYGLDVADLPFESDGIEWLWSSTPSAHQATSAWAVGADSYTNSNDVSVPSRVQCVRNAR
jgi:hypothetical protein